jgi:hypothetical protein
LQLADRELQERISEQLSHVAFHYGGQLTRPAFSRRRDEVNSAPAPGMLKRWPQHKKSWIG